MNYHVQRIFRSSVKTIMSRFTGILVCMMIISQASWCLAVDPSKFKSLFPVRLEHEFLQSKETFEEVKQLILDQYYSEDITEDALYWGAIKGMMRYISPPEIPGLSKIWTAEAYETILNSIKGEQISIGIKSTFNPKEGSLTVTEVLPDSPAESILKPYDRILRIDSKPLKGKSLAEVNEMLNGEAETPVKLTVNRDIKVFEVTLRYQKFTTQNLIVTRLNDAVALVEIKQFAADMAKELKAEIESLKNDGFSELIIDLRNNPGGLLMEALRMAELFVPVKGVMLRTLTRETNLQNYVSVNKAPYEFKIAVLVNHKTASSAEVLASSLQDHQKAFIIGTKTFGKGVFENTFTLSNHFRVKFITGAMYSPKGRTWQGKGITPDFLIEQNEKTLAVLMRMDPVKRFSKDVAMITAYKLLEMLD